MASVWSFCKGCKRQSDKKRLTLGANFKGLRAQEIQVVLLLYIHIHRLLNPFKRLSKEIHALITDVELQVTSNARNTCSSMFIVTLVSVTSVNLR